MRWSKSHYIFAAIKASLIAVALIQGALHAEADEVRGPDAAGPNWVVSQTAPGAESVLTN